MVHYIHHYGRDANSVKTAWLKTKAVYPLFFLTGATFAYVGVNMFKNVFYGQANVSRSQQGIWATQAPWVWQIRGSSPEPSPIDFSENQ